LKAQWFSLVQRVRSTCVNFSQIRPTAKALYCSALALPLSLVLTACSDMGSDGDIEVLQQQEQLRSDMQRLEANTSRSSLRDALENPRLHPYPLARAIYEQSDLQAQASAFLIQFAVTLSMTDAAPALLDEELDQLLEIFQETNQVASSYARGLGYFYFQMFGLSQQTANTERTEWLRQQTENRVNRIDGGATEVGLKERLFNYYLEIGEPEFAYEHMAQLEDYILRTLWATRLAQTYAKQGQEQAAIDLIDGVYISRNHLLYLIEDWVEALTLVDRKDQASQFLLRLRDLHLNLTTLESHSPFLAHSQRFHLIIRLLSELDHDIEAREALRRGYQYCIENFPSDSDLMRGLLPYLKGFTLQNEAVLLDEATRAIFARLYDLMQTSDQVERHIFEFIDIMQELELNRLGLEFIDAVAQTYDLEQREDAALLTFVLSHAYATFGDKMRGDRYLQRLVNDRVQLEALMQSSGLKPRLVLTHLLEMGYVDEAQRLMEIAPEHEHLLFIHFLFNERFVDALAFTAERDVVPAQTIYRLLNIAGRYLQLGKLPDADARALMTQHWSDYMPLAKEN